MPNRNPSPEIIVAMSKSGIIGKEGKLPWNNPADLKHFKQMTSGNVVIMGRKTWDSLPARAKPLPGRINIVVSTTKKRIKGAQVAQTLKDAIHRAQQTITTQKKSSPVKIFLIGGARIYQDAVKSRLARTMHISIISGRHTGDTHFPKFDKRKWRLTHSEQKQGFVYQVRDLGRTKKIKH